MPLSFVKGDYYHPNRLKIAPNTKIMTKNVPKAAKNTTKALESLMNVSFLRFFVC